MFRLLVTGSRELPDAEFVWLPLWHMIHKHEAMIVVHGDCPYGGADLFAQQWVDLPGQQWNRRQRGLKNGTAVERLALAERHPADWKGLGKAAGPRRNQQMVTAGADACFAFPTATSRGTLDCMARAWNAGIPVWRFSDTELGRMHRITDEEGEELVKRMLR